MSHEDHFDEILIDRIKKGDKNAFESLYEKYWETLFKYGYHRLKKREVVEGLVQEIFVFLLQDRDRLDIRHSLIGFLKTCMKFKILNHHKLQVVKEKYQATLGNSGSNSCMGVEEGIWYEELQLAYTRQIEGLPNQAKRAYRLKMESGMTCAEIANELQLSISTVEKHLMKANRILRENLRRFYLIGFWLAACLI